MSNIERIIFPFSLKSARQTQSKRPQALFFGADFYNLPRDSNQRLFIDCTNKILDLIRRELPDHEFVYQPHPNETDESKHLNLDKFTVGKRTIAEIYLYENAEKIDYVFSAQSGASISAYAMGFDSVIFLDLLRGVLSESSITGYRSYFSGLPDYCFRKSFDGPLPRRKPASAALERAGLDMIAAAIDPAGTLYIISSDPSTALHGAVLVEHLREGWPALVAKLIMINHHRWQVAKDNRTIARAYNEIKLLPWRRVWYSTKWSDIKRARLAAHQLKQFPFEPGDTLLSLANGLFEENCLLSYQSRVKKILLMGNRLYKFIYDGGYRDLPSVGWRMPLGAKIFAYFLEPLFGLNRTYYEEYTDGKVLNLFRYRRPLAEIYDDVFVIMPANEKAPD